ncbi:MAG TPA: response regulator [Thermodesulfobacteriota bacterium]
MGGTAGKAQVAVLNASDDILELLRRMLEHEGLTTVTAHVDDVKRGRLDLIEFLEAHDPDVILYDIAPPYEDNWAFFRLVRATDAARGRTFIITTTNKQALEQLVGPVGAHEIVGKPFDVDAVLESVRQALARRETFKA